MINNDPNAGKPQGLSLIFALLLGACAAPEPIAPGAFVFGVLGDAPYNELEAERLDRVIDEMNREPLAFVVHVGDIGTSALGCTDEWLLARKAQFARIRHPFLLIPGDNEWSDCTNPMERLARWRELFCNTDIKVERQNDEYCEHVRWEANNWIFVALNVPGSNNNLRHPEYAPRMKAVHAWLDEASALAEKRKGLVVLMQANPFVRSPRDGYADLRAKLEMLGKRNAGRVVLIHGDTHLYRDDEPLPGVRRIEVWGSPFVSWTRVAP
ncbi:MAG: hypothetical protein A3G27_08260 [Betaproteobacteria bacterium RIFCSPLOWO2_12_FULL_66_14]|nr:MAG: hypothetical protein A3G27_08260 [Betaproteobacteria bacterium RIFCSPLOWO2_12_FULL_66_14]